MGDAEPIASVVRSGLEESVHLGDAAVCDADGRLVAWLGDPGRPLFARSSMKPLQAAVCLSVLEEDVPDDEVAIMCASHNGEVVHLDAVRAVLGRAGVGEAALRCPPGWPLDPEVMANAGRSRPLLHNCSGKHAGKLLACSRAGWDSSSYLEPDHPLQARILSTVQRASGPGDVVVGIDGCGSPVHGMALERLATIFARLALPERLGDLAPQAARATEAMMSRPYLVAGRHRVDTAVMESTANVFVKAGAEGLVCAGVAGEGIGVAVKVRDGAARGAAPALVRVLEELGLVGATELERLAEHRRPPVLGAGRPVGEITSTFALRRP